VDLSADYRYRSLGRWQEVYAAEARELERSDADLCSEAVYGLPEWYADQIASARLVAAPGCFPTVSLLGLLPFLKQGLVEAGGIVIDGKTGTSWAARPLGRLSTAKSAAAAIASASGTCTTGSSARGRNGVSSLQRLPLLRSPPKNVTRRLGWPCSKRRVWSPP